MAKTKDYRDGFKEWLSAPRNKDMTKTCETCKFFVPVTDHRLFDGACHNKRATLGAVIQTSRGSTCNYHEPIVNQQDTRT